jgi:hypothetical protein
VNVNVDVAPLIIGFVKKDFVRVGAGAGMRHPVNVTLSMAKRELLFCEPVAEILKTVEPVLAVKEEFPSEAPNVADPFAVIGMPSALTVTAAVFQLALVCM